MRIKRSLRRSGERSEEGVDIVDGPEAELDGGAATPRNGGRTEEDADVDRNLGGGDFGAGDLGDRDLDDRDLDDRGPGGGPVRGARRRPGDTLVDDRVARSRAPQTATMREGFHPRQFLHEVNVEMRKVAWPTRKETANYSTVVFITLAVLMGLIFGLDYAFNQVSIFLFK